MLDKLNIERGTIINTIKHLGHQFNKYFLEAFFIYEDLEYDSIQLIEENRSFYIFFQRENLLENIFQSSDDDKLYELNACKVIGNVNGRELKTARFVVDKENNLKTIYPYHSESELGLYKNENTKKIV